MHFRVLGPLEVEHNGKDLTPRAAKQRKVLAALLLQGNRPVKISELIRELWDDEPPASAVNTLQTYVLRIRRMLDAAASEGGRPSGKHVLLTAPVGYQFRLGHGQLDLHDFERLSEAGVEAMQHNQFHIAAMQFRAALERSRGPALADVQAGPLLSVHVARLAEQVLRVRELRIEANLRLGRHAMLISELTGLAAEHPTHERFHGQLMVALYTAGRRAEALDLFRRLRASMVRELGLEPADWLTRLQHAILTGESGPLNPVATPAYQAASSW
ncbi:AfsR/SARP family transcriptional regulator [Dactylosporangium sp. CA-052675]|uniref:AfsR/SARP family transcriptional regulator n=1 Tax=Dactylosporangium sp. CA-052675 TaxID=3239927 RepID=UPI003D8C1E54